MKKTDRHPFLLVSDEDGNIFEIPELYMTGMEAGRTEQPDPADLIPLPYGSDLFMLPGCIPVGWDPERETAVPLSEYRGRKVFAVAAFMAPAYIQYYLASFVKTPASPLLPLYSYTAVGFFNNTFYVPASRIDDDIRQDLRFVDLNAIKKKAPKVRRRFKGNRLVEHLIDNCALCYGCPAARNFVMERWECPVPTSPGCNAACVGCISKQPEDSGFKPAQDRLNFIPSVKEITEFTVPHLESAPRPVISFGQGCEGEPLLAAGRIAEAVREIRGKTDRGIINLNTNASLPEKVELLCKAGLDSIRVSMNSAQRRFYTSYYNPEGYTFEDVIESIKTAKRYGLWVSLNYFIFPGLTDRKDELAALEEIIREPGINMIQTRNTNIDPFLYIEKLELEVNHDDRIGIRNWVDYIKKQYPEIKLGYFNPPRESMGPY